MSNIRALKINVREYRRSN